MDYVPSWQSPIDVALPVSDERWVPNLGAITYGLVSTELVEAQWPERGFPSRLIERLGRANLLAAARSFGELFGDPDVAGANRLREIVNNEFAPLVAPITAAASEARALAIPPSPAVLRLTQVYGPNVFMPRRLRRDERMTWGHSFASIVEQAAVEVFEIHASQPRLRRCVYCQSAFVPWRDERCCRWNLWGWPATTGDLALRLCSHERHQASERFRLEPDARQTHSRERKRLWAKVARERQAAAKTGAPSSSKRVKDAEQALHDYLANSTVRRGRPSTHRDDPGLLPS